MLKNKANASFQDPTFLTPFPTLALFLAPPITIITLAIHSIANYNFSATAHAGIFQNAGKSAPFF